MNSEESSLKRWQWRSLANPQKFMIFGGVVHQKVVYSLGDCYISFPAAKHEINETANKIVQSSVIIQIADWFEEIGHERLAPEEIQIETRQGADHDNFRVLVKIFATFYVPEESLSLFALKFK